MVNIELLSEIFHAYTSHKSNINISRDAAGKTLSWINTWDVSPIRRIPLDDNIVSGVLAKRYRVTDCLRSFVYQWLVHPVTVAGALRAGLELGVCAYDEHTWAPRHFAGAARQIDIDSVVVEEGAEGCVAGTWVGCASQAWQMGDFDSILAKWVAMGQFVESCICEKKSQLIVSGMLLRVWVP